MKKLLLLLLITSPLFAQQRVGQIDQDSTATRLTRGWAVLSNVNGALWMTYRDANNAVTKYKIPNQAALDAKAATIDLRAKTLTELRALTTTELSTRYTYLSEDGGVWQYDPSDNSTADNTGIVVVTGGGKRLKRILNGYVTLEMFGGSGDGVTSNNAAIVAAIACGVRVVSLGEGTYKVDKTTLPTLENITFVGKGAEKTTILCTSGSGMFFVGNIKNVRFEGIHFRATGVYAPIDFGNGIFYSFQKNTENLEFLKCKFSMPSANATALCFLVRWNVNNGAGPSGSLKNINIRGCVFDSIGQSAIAIGNRDTTAAKLDYAYNVNVTDCKFLNLGLYNNYGFAITLDGVGKGIKYNNNYHYNLYDIAVENTGYWYSEFLGNTFDGFLSGRTYFPFSFSTREMRYNTVSNNQTLSPSSGGVNFFLVNNSYFSNNNFTFKGDKCVTYRNSSDNILTGERYTGEYLYALLLQSTSGNVTTNNKIIDSKISNSGAASNNATLSFSGSGVTANYVYNTELTKGTGGNLIAQESSATGNFFTGMGYDYLSTTLFDADYTLPAQAEMLNYRMYNFAGSLTATRTITFPAKDRSTTVRNSTGQSLVISNGTNSITIPSGRTQAIRFSGTSIFPDGPESARLSLVDATNTFTTENFFDDITPRADGTKNIGKAGAAFSSARIGTVWLEKIKERFSSSNISFLSNNDTERVRMLSNGNWIFGSPFADASTGRVQVNGNIGIWTGGKINIGTGTNASVGTATLVAGTVTVNTTAIASTSQVFITRKTAGGTIGDITYTQVNGTSITFTSTSASDTSTFNWWIIN